MGTVVSESIQPISSLADRQLEYGEVEMGGAFTCSYCHRKVPASEPVATVVYVIEQGERIEIDGRYCCENCGEADAMTAEFVDARPARHLTDDHEISGATDGIGNTFSDADPGL